MGLTIYFDGACPLCSREMNHYRRKDRASALHFVDIADPAFDATAAGLDSRRVQEVMHVRTADGRIRTGVDAFIEIWRALPGHRWLIRLVSLPGLRQLSDLTYHVFARYIRPRLPKRVRDCDSGTCAR